MPGSSLRPPALRECGFFLKSRKWQPQLIFHRCRFRLVRFFGSIKTRPAISTFRAAALFLPNLPCVSGNIAQRVTWPTRSWLPQVASLAATSSKDCSPQGPRYAFVRYNSSAKPAIWHSLVEASGGSEIHHGDIRDGELSVPR